LPPSSRIVQPLTVPESPLVDQSFPSIEQVVEKAPFFVMLVIIMIVVLIVMSAIITFRFSILRWPGIHILICPFNNFIQFSAIQPHTPTLGAEVDFHTLPFCDLQGDIA
jgi:hypothetical protein